MITSVALGVGTVSTAADTFALTIGGVDYSDARKNAAGAFIPLETLRLQGSTDSNATAEFTIEDPSRAVQVSGFSEVIVWEKQDTERLLFSGLVMVTDVLQEGLGRLIKVRAVDYGYLLDRRQAYSAIPSQGTTEAAVQSATSVVGGIGPISTLANEWADGFARPSSAGQIAIRQPGKTFYHLTYPTTGSLRSILESLAESTYDYLAWPFEAYPCVVYVDALKRLNVRPVSMNVGTAPREIVDTTPAAGEANAEGMAVTTDWTGVTTEIRVQDASAPDYSGTLVVDTSEAGGRALAGITFSSIDLVASDSYVAFGQLVASGGPQYPTVRGSFDIETTEYWAPGQLVTITSTAMGLSGDYLIQAVSTQFLAGNGRRRCTVSFGGNTTTNQTGAKAESAMRRTRALFTKVGA